MIKRRTINHLNQAIKCSMKLISAPYEWLCSQASGNIIYLDRIPVQDSRF